MRAQIKLGFSLDPPIKSGEDEEKEGGDLILSLSKDEVVLSPFSSAWLHRFFIKKRGQLFGNGTAQLFRIG